VETYFVRHTDTLGIEEPMLRSLWKARKIAIHYPEGKHGRPDEHDLESLDPDAYSGSARKAVNALTRLAEEGGYVCAEYYPFDEVLVGLVRPAAQIELVRGRWGDRYPENKGLPATVKALQLERVRVIPAEECVNVLIGRPRQGTLMRWPNAGSRIRQLVERETAALGLGDLTPTQQEVLCSEFLRTPSATELGLPLLAHLLLPVGRTMKDVDIYGVAQDAKTLFAQVTYADDWSADWKLERLRTYRGDGNVHLVLFCKTREARIERGVHVIPLQAVFSRFASTPAGAIWLSRLRPAE
jgi:hypothetical protein